MDFDAYTSCELCPRRCHAQRRAGVAGICGATAELRIARAALHYWEEPPLSGEAGSGAIFFSGCPLRCIFCQNREISQEHKGQSVNVRRLAAIMCELERAGALNINLVTPLHFAPHIREAVMRARTAGMALPIVCNTSGYETVETLRAMEDCVDIWLTDYKYDSRAYAASLSHAADYPDVAEAALLEMAAQLHRAGGRAERADGSMTRGIIVRHLVLPGHIEDSLAVIDRVWQLVGNQVDLSVMNQYTPNEPCRARHDDLARSVTDEEYETVLEHADECGFERMWWQQGGTVSESFVPAFDATGVLGPELP